MRKRAAGCYGGVPTFRALMPLHRASGTICALCAAKIWTPWVHSRLEAVVFRSMRSVIIATAGGMRATDGHSLMGGRCEVILLCRCISCKQHHTDAKNRV